MEQAMDRDERLARYCDGEMDAAERAAFEDDLARDPQLAEQLASWRRNDFDIGADFDAMMADGAPERVSALLAGSPSAQIVSLADERSQGAASIAAPIRLRRWFVPGAIAASLAGVVLLGMLQLSGPNAPSLGELDDLPSGQSIALADGSEMTAVLTFADAEGRWCREYAIDTGVQGIACREHGMWAIETESSAAAAPSSSPDGQYVTAGADAVAELDEAYARLGAGDPLGREQEQALMDSGWTLAAD